VLVLKIYVWRGSASFGTILELLIFLLAYIIFLVGLNFSKEEKATFLNWK